MVLLELSSLGHLDLPTGLATSAITRRSCGDLTVSDSVTRLTVRDFAAHLTILYPVGPKSSPQFHRDAIAPAVRARKACLLSKLKIESLLCQLPHSALDT